MDNFFKKKEQVSIKCSNCLLQKKKLCTDKKDTEVYKQFGKNKDILIILEMQENEDRMLEFLKVLNKQKLFNEFNFTITTGLLCRSKDYEIPSPIYKIYRNCNCIQKEKYEDYKVIITIGRGLFSITQSDDISGWQDFDEYLFNQTYFYTGIDWKNKIRVYPLPIFNDWLHYDNFSNFFVKKQFKFIYDYLKNYSKFEVKPYQVNVIKNPNDYLKQNLNKQRVTWDIETSSLNMFDKNFEVGCISISNDGNIGNVLDFSEIDKELLSQYFENKYKIGAALKFDIKCLLKKGIKNCDVDEDITLLAHVLSTERNKNGQKTLAWHIGMGGYDRELDLYMEKNKIKCYLDVPKRILFPYAGMDAIVGDRIYDYLMELTKLQPKVYECYKKVLIPVTPVFAKIEIEGMELNTDYINELNKKLEEKTNNLEKQIFEILGEKINLNSAEQLARILEEKQFPDLGRSKKKFWLDNQGKEHYFYKVGVNQLNAWKNMGHKVIELILDYRTQLKLNDAFVGKYTEEDNEENDSLFFGKKKDDSITNEKQKGLLKFLCDDGKLHPNYGPGRTNTWRSNCNSPNIQQLPKAGEEGKLFRPVFKCPENYLFGEADESGFQLRIAAIYSHDKNMKDVFLNKGGDLHSTTCVSIFCKNMSLEDFLKVKDKEPYSHLRFKAKNQINFPLLFSNSPWVIYNTIANEWTEEERDSYIKENDLEILDGHDKLPDKIITVCTSLRYKFFETYPELKSWLEGQHDKGKKGYIDSYHGIRRHLPQLTYLGEDVNQSELRNLLNITTNTGVQAFEAYVIYENMIKVDKMLSELNLKSKLIGMIHDSLIFNIFKPEIKQVYEIIQKCMNNYTTYSIPLIGELKISKVLGFGKEVTNENIGEF